MVWNVTVESTVLCTYDGNQAILEPLLPYHASKCKQPQTQCSRTVYKPTFLPFLLDNYNLLFISETLIITISYTKCRVEN